VGSKSVAIVDDDASVNRALGRWLRAAGFEPSGFDSAESFLSDPSRKSFDCLLIDIQLTGISGLELQRRLQAEGSTCPPIIFISAQDNPEFYRQAIECGCAGYFLKTDPGQLILDALRRATAPKEESWSPLSPSISRAG
jgi:FixJ family two-component response regulator